MYTVFHMEALLNMLPIIQIALAIILTGVILLQQRGAGLGGAFGGAEGGVHYERRGFERTLFKATIVIAVVFVLSVIASALITDPVSIETEDVVIPTDDTILNSEGITVETTTETEDGEIEIIPIDMTTSGNDDIPTESE